MKNNLFPKKIFSEIENDFLLETYVCAKLSQLAYATPGHELADLTDYFDFIMPVVTGVSKAYACSKDTKLYIVFAGTNFKNLNDILVNVHVRKVPEGNGLVHVGYQDHLNKIWDNITKIIDANPDKKIIFTGHSMGGGVGQIACFRTAKSTGYFFGSTRSVNGTIVIENQSTITHFQNVHDIVPELPPRIPFGFRHIGDVFLVKRDHIWHKPQSVFEFFRTIYYGIVWGTLKLLSKITPLQPKIFDVLVKNHRMATYEEIVASIIKNHKK